jgi:hypothetical protein
VLDTLVASSAGILDDKVGAAVQEEGTLAPHRGSLDETKLELRLKFLGARVLGKCDTSRQVKS